MNKLISKPLLISNKFYFKSFIDGLEFKNLFEALKDDNQNMICMMRDLTTADSFFAYSTGKWTTLQVVQHIIDCERIFQYRALAIARGETNKLQGFDENFYAMNSLHDGLTIEDVLDEFVTVREATVSLFKNMNPLALDREGIAFNLPFTPRIIAWFIAAHSIHHLEVIKTKYLKLNISGDKMI